MGYAEAFPPATTLTGADEGTWKPLASLTVEPALYDRVAVIKAMAWGTLAGGTPESVSLRVREGASNELAVMFRAPAWANGCGTDTVTMHTIPAGQRATYAMDATFRAEQGQNTSGMTFKISANRPHDNYLRVALHPRGD
ncbi:hypothetical protein [Streptomyces olivoreticuli]|uniref:hypothetical protein n=1 Tax=Streptomyces olivoreticuli TaxID=68246 RepID=UPI000E24F259|nr:hypothetical protein [Streptomyces olivoreticuli]